MDMLADFQVRGWRQWYVLYCKIPRRKQRGQLAGQIVHGHRRSVKLHRTVNRAWRLRCPQLPMKTSNHVPISMVSLSLELRQRTPRAGQHRRGWRNLARNLLGQPSRNLLRLSMDRRNKEPRRSRESDWKDKSCGISPDGYIMWRENGRRNTTEIRHCKCCRSVCFWDGISCAAVRMSCVSCVKSCLLVILILFLELSRSMIGLHLAVWRLRSEVILSNLLIREHCAIQIETITHRNITIPISFHHPLRVLSTSNLRMYMWWSRYIIYFPMLFRPLL
jgi:hypothetical protein